MLLFAVFAVVLVIEMTTQPRRPPPPRYREVVDDQHGYTYLELIPPGQ